MFELSSEQIKIAKLFAKKFNHLTLAVLVISVSILKMLIIPK